MAPCHFYNKPSGCRHGDSCKFEHIASASGSSSAHKGPAPASPTKHKNPLPKAPIGTCDFYWNKGSCTREFSCRYKHTRNPALAPASGADASLPPTWRHPFSPSNRPSKDLSPTEIHDALKRFRWDSFRFVKTFDVYAFVGLLSSVDTSGPLWTPEDAPLLLSALAKDNGLLRINDVIRWPQVSNEAGSSPQVLSFQRGFVPLLKFLASDLVLKSTLEHLVNALYMRILENFETWSSNLTSCMRDILVLQSFRDPAATEDKSIGMSVFSSLGAIFFEILTRFKDATSKHPGLPTTVRDLRDWTEVWISGVTATPAAFGDPFVDTPASARDHILRHLRSQINRLITIVDREQGRAERMAPAAVSRQPRSQEGLAAALQALFETDGPGELRESGPRHDNDCADISHIQVAPTHEELISRVAPFLPGNFHGAPHHLAAESMERLLDIQFRLLREELTSSLRSAVQLVRQDLIRNSPQTMLSKLIKSRGGKYRGQADDHDQVMFNLYTNVAFVAMPPDWRGISVQISFDTPPGRARQPTAKSRVGFWEGVSGKRLIQGGLVALLWQSGADIHVYLATIASSLKDLTESAARGNGSERVAIRLSFFSPDVELRVLNALKSHEVSETGMKLLVECPVMFESIRPFLEALRREPESFPFGQYLVHRKHDFFASHPIAPPRYALAPGFKYQLASLFDNGVESLELDASDPVSVANAREQLRASRLDPSQADAVVDTLTREVALIQGPPGTGKSYTGVELFRILLANKIGPILLISFTNHALDHLLSSILDAGITQKIVRLGSRSADERISQYSLETREFAAGKNRLYHSFRDDHNDLKRVQKEIDTLMQAYVNSEVSSDELKRHLQYEYPEHYEHLYLWPPGLVQELLSMEADEGGEWEHVDRHGKVVKEDNSVYTFWRRCRDLDYIESALQQEQQRIEAEKQASRNRFDALTQLEEEDQSETSEDDHVPSEEEQSDSDSDDDDSDTEQEPWQQAWRALPAAASIAPEPSPPQLPVESPPPSPRLEPEAGPSKLPSLLAAGLGVPDSDRPLATLLSEGTMWSFSRRERARLGEFWSHEIKDRLDTVRLDKFAHLRETYAAALKRNKEGQDEIRRTLLQNVDIVGCTTTGAAKLTSLLKSLSPRVMLVEEAGQVLEAHILGSLVPSVEHLILIGDPLQLRPNLNTYALSMDNKRGKELYKFDMSLMERLSSNNAPMSQINVQRRMRPQISSLIRDALYPALEDNQLVKKYPDVHGFSKNVFFFNHSHRENDGGDETSSKYNTFEVQMIKDLVLHLLRQGCYSEEGDIVVLCAYLGQLARVRDAFGSLSEIAVLIDGKDKQDLNDEEGELDDQAHIEHVKVTKRVRLRTIDNYQGEEAKIVILSTVRNAGSQTDGSESRMPARPTIGFLVSENRTNVALSRAKEGMFILGNAAQLSTRSNMWRSVIEQLESVDCVGDAFPVSCHRHPETVHFVSEPDKIPLFAPDGGCLEPCSYRLKCGHMCQYKCHPDDPKHLGVTCSKPCLRLCPRLHPCEKECSQDCGKCTFILNNVELPCGHRAPAVECWRLDNLEDVRCTTVVVKHFSDCEHSTEMECSTEPSEMACSAPCNGIMPCCGRTCLAKCYECQTKNDKIPGELVVRAKHQPHKCEKNLFCGHKCGKTCSENHECTTSCQQQCRQQCKHSQCKEYCSTPCAPCMKPCDWACLHRGRCPLPCGSVCSRLPCDVACSKKLRCGHPCPSVCGEDCSIQVCVECASPSRKQDVVDMILYRTLEDVEPSLGGLDELLITLKCGHVFTVETLDGHVGMLDFYVQENDVWRGLRSPEAGGETRAPPVCPTCRAAITSPRYGRVFKSADLDILERNVISTMTKRLDKLQNSMSAVSKDDMADTLKREASKMAVSTLVKSDSDKKRSKARKAALVAQESTELPIPLQSLLPGGALHGVTSALAGAWKRATQRLSTLYEDSIRVARMRSAHMVSWEAAFSTLYRQEMDRAAADPSRAPRFPAEHAMRMASIQVGHTKPLADRRFVVEAFWATIKLRITMGDLARSWLPELIEHAKNLSMEEAMRWADFGSFIFDSCVHDSELAFSIAEKSGSRRQMTTSRLLQMRSQFERFRYSVDMTRAAGLFDSAREKLVDDAAMGIHSAEEMFTTTTRDHLARLRNDQEWLADNFAPAAEAIVGEWRSLELSISRRSFYQPVSLDEKMKIVKALQLSHTGHFYTCPQGHVYVIGECGGAMQRSRCPECGASIGGSNHNLDSTNRRATDYSDLARQAGMQEDPWRWRVGA
uniref:P-loop containing nucleoside triphosphate hydrolase protein n=1 Tax=Mycena chlorophos TaxID=658473 RepID=A0ABQ0KVS4_MYCCL|nr:predicted protein [Mycena chlorophos]